MNKPQPAPWIETLLSDAAHEAQWPATPDLRASVMQRLGEHTSTVRRLPSRRALGTALAALVLLVVAVLANPSTRTAVAEFFGLVEGYRIEIVSTPTPPAEPSSVPSTPTPSSWAIIPLGFATQTTLEAAASAAGFAPGLPAGEPEAEVYLAQFGEQTFV